MKVSTISNFLGIFYPQKSHNKKNLQKNRISFGSRVIYEDSKVPLTYSEKEYINKFEDGRAYDTRFLGEGVVSKAYLSTNQGFVIKQNKYNPYVKEKSREEMGSLAHENKMLLSIDENVKTTQRGIAYVETEDGGKFLISTYVKGKPANRFTNPFKEKHIDRLLRNLYRLDKSMIIHSDLSNPNLLLDLEDNVNIIDYQWADKYSLWSNYSNYTLRNSAFPYFETPNNASMFEAAGLAGYTRPMSISNANTFLRKYYANKAPYIEKNIRRLEGSGYNLPEAIEFEKAKYRAYSAMDDSILNAEALKMNILNLHRRQFSCHDTNKVEPRNILRAIPLCIRGKECAEELSYYYHGSSVDADYYKYMRKYGDFWQEKMSSWYSDALKWIFKLVSGGVNDPAKVFFPEKFNDYSNLDIVDPSSTFIVSRRYSAEDTKLRELFKDAHFWGYNSRYCKKDEAYKIIDKVFKVR